MEKNWKQIFCNQIDDLLYATQEFYKKWTPLELENIVNTCSKIRDIDIKDRFNTIDKSISFFKNKKKSSANKKNVNEFLKELDSQLKDSQGLNIINYLNEEEKYQLNSFLLDYNEILLTKDNFEKFSQVSRFFSLLGCVITDIYDHIGRYSLEWLDNSFSQYCKQEFARLVLRIYLGQYNEELQPFISHIYSKNELLSGFVICKKSKFSVYPEEDIDKFRNEHDQYKPCSLIPVEYLLELKNKVNSIEATSIIDLVIKEMVEKGITVPYEFVQLKESYEKTPEEIMVLDQKYYSESSLEIQRQKAEDEQRYREEQLKLQSQQARYREKQLKLQERQAEEEEDYRREERKRQERIEAENKRFQEHQIQEQRRQAEAIYDSRIAELKAEKIYAEDYAKKTEIQKKIDILMDEKKKMH